MEFEEAELRGCLPDLSCSAAHQPAAEPLHRLASAVAGRACLVGDTLTLADVAVFATLLPVFSRLPVSPLLHAMHVHAFRACPIIACTSAQSIPIKVAAGL